MNSTAVVPVVNRSLDAVTQYNMEYANGYNAGFEAGLAKVHHIVIALFLIMVCHVAASRLQKMDVKYADRLETGLFAAKNMLIAFLFVAEFVPVVRVTGL